ncbi:hypothetical protein AGMMS50239_21790 [Bacteroidia bacterium]|nr:hypothetical protein AGMMS50239_21790 [Bacteroidia bacterium]
MTKKIFKLSVLSVLTLCMVACGEKQIPRFFKEIQTSAIAIPVEKDKYLPFEVEFDVLEGEKPYVQYISRNGDRRNKIFIHYSHLENDEGDNSIIYFFNDEIDEKNYGVYQIRVKYNEIVKLRYVSKDKTTNVPYSVGDYADLDKMVRNYYYHQVFDNISYAVAVADKKGYLPLQMYFTKNGDAYVRYIDKKGKLGDKIILHFKFIEYQENEEGVSLHFDDEINGTNYGEYTVWVDDNKVSGIFYMKNQDYDSAIHYSITKSIKRK